MLPAARRNRRGRAGGGEALGLIEAAQAQMLQFVQAEPKRAELKIALGQFYEASRKGAEAE